MLSIRACLCAIALMGSAAAAPVVTTRPALECGHHHCPPASWSDRGAHDMAVLTITAKTPLQFYYGSDGGARPARIVEDDAGCEFVFVEYAIGRGPGASVWLAVLRLGEHTELMRKMQIRYWLGPGSAAEYRTEIDKPFGGGLTLRLTRHIAGRDIGWRYPPLSETVSIPMCD